MKKLTSFIFLLFLFNNSLFALEVDRGKITKIENYLNSITSIKSDFLQLNSDGSVSEGVFFLSKPGKFRWEYNDQPILVIANGKSLIYYDTELEQANYVPIEKSIASLITRKTIKIGNDVKITKFKETKDSTKISLIRKGQKDIGEFTFVFQNEPFELGKIELVDNAEQKVVVSFINKEINSGKFPKKLFIIKDPRLGL